MRTLLQFLALSDRYERKARLLPGLVAASPIGLTAALLAPSLLDWGSGLVGSLVLEVVLGVVLGLLARARGKVVEESLWVQWNGPPTTRLLRPDSTESSETVRVRWRKAVKDLTGMVIPASMPDGKTPSEVDQIIADAVRQLRYTLRDKEEARLVSVHNEDYGFARNLLGLRPHWLAASCASLLACGIAFWAGYQAWAALAVALVSLAIAVLVSWELPSFVRRCADRYAESLLSTAVTISRSAQSSKDV